MNDFTDTGVITDDPRFAAELCSYFGREEQYFPILSLPRMERDDWEFEVNRRIYAIGRSGVKTIVCRSEDYGLLAPLRSKMTARILPIGVPEDIRKFLQGRFPSDYLEVFRNDYREGLIRALREKKVLKLVEEKREISQAVNRSSKRVIIVERTNEVTDVAAIAYSSKKGFDISFFSAPKTYLERWEVEERFRSIFLNLSNDTSIQEGLHVLKKEIARIVDLSEIEGLYNEVQFVVEGIPYGLLIEKATVAHLFHLESDLKFIDEVFYLAKQRAGNGKTPPSFLFLDTDEQDLI